MNNPQGGNEPSIDAIAGDIVDRDPSNGTGRPGKKTVATKLRRRPAVWLVALVVIAAVGAVLALTLHSGSPSAGGGKPPHLAGYVCHGAEATVFDNINSDAVSNGASQPGFSTGGKAYCLMYVQTYHWNKGKGRPPGSVGLVRSTGAPLPAYIASLQAQASSSQGVPNVNWSASVPIAKPVIIDGTYSCADSDPSTWSSDSASHGAGFCIVKASLAVPPSK